MIFYIFSANWPIPGLMPKYLSENGYASSVSNIMSIGALGIMLGVLLSGYLADKFGSVKVLVGGLSLSLLMIYPTFLIGPGHEILTGSMLFLLLATNLGVGGLIPKYLSQLFPVDMRGAAFGFIYNLAAIGGGIAPVTCAFFTDKYNLSLGQALIFVTAFWSLLLVILVGLRIPNLIQAKFNPQEA